MAWYTTGTIAVSGTTVTGTGTNFLDNTQSIGPGQALLIPGSGTVKMYEVASVQSATKLTLKTTAGTIAAGQAYAILSFYTDSVPDFARRLAAQLSYYQSQMDGWQQIMTGTGSITMTAPDGTTVTISSFSKLTADLAAALPQMGNLGTAGVTDINNLGPVSGGIGIWDANNSASYSLPNIPEAQAGVLEVLVGGGFRGTQRYTTRYGNIYIRSLTASWNATSPSWGPWCLSGFTYRNQSSLDLNTLTNAAFVGGTLTNGPAAMGNATCFISSNARFDGALIFQTAQYTTTGRVFTRSCVSGTWTAWAESLTTNSVVAIANGGTGSATPFGTAAGTFAQGNDSRLNTVNNKSGGVITSAVNITNGGLQVDNAANITSRALRNGASGATTQGGWIQSMFTGSGTTAQFSTFIEEVVGNTLYGVLTLGDGSQFKRWIFGIGGNAVASNGTWINGSDERFKTDLLVIDDALEKVKSLTGYTGKRDGNIFTGLIAQDLQKVLPEAVSSMGDYTVQSDVNDLKKGDVIPDALGVAYGDTVGLLVEAIKELSGIVDKQNNVITELQKRMKAIDGLDA